MPQIVNDRQEPFNRALRQAFVDMAMAFEALDVKIGAMTQDISEAFAESNKLLKKIENKQPVAKAKERR